MLCLVAASSLALAQSPPPDPQASQTPAPAASAAPVWSVGPIDFSGLIDAYYDVNLNHPASGLNGLYNFDVKANQFSLNMAKLSMSHDADPVGFRVDFGFGRAFDIIHAGEPKDAPAIVRNIEQAYVSWKPKQAKGLQLDFGQYVTMAGAEVIESHSNWNYSRSLLFAWAIPYYHFGLRASFPIGSHFNAGIHVANGWNTMEDINTGKTVGFSGALTGKKVTWTNTYHTGPENAGTNRGFKNLYDTTLLLTPADKFNAYINFDYGTNRSYDASGKNGATATWYGVAVATKFQMNGKNALTPRYEWYNDQDGYTTGQAAKLQEFTITYEYKWAEGLFSRLEYRRDWSGCPSGIKETCKTVAVFERGLGGSSDHQDTLALGLVAFFGPKR
jgi:hypothetical protein